MDWKSKILSSPLMMSIESNASKESEEIREEIERVINNMTGGVVNSLLNAAFFEKFGMSQADVYKEGNSDELMTEMENFIFENRKEILQELKPIIKKELITNLIGNYEGILEKYFD